MIEAAHVKPRRFGGPDIDDDINIIPLRYR